MFSDHDIRGEPCRYDDEPDWQPLYDVVGVELAHWFMWMGGIELEDGGYVHPYKHRATRRYLHLAEDGRAFAYVPRGRYREIPRREAIELAFERWEEVVPTPDEEDSIALQRARRAADAHDSRSTLIE